MGEVIMEHIIDEKGKWRKKGIFKTLVEPSEEYLQHLEQERLNNLLKPTFNELDVSEAEIQLAHFILDITDRVEKLEEVMGDV